MSRSPFAGLLHRLILLVILVLISCFSDWQNTDAQTWRSRSIRRIVGPPWGEDRSPEASGDLDTTFASSASPATRPPGVARVDFTTGSNDHDRLRSIGLLSTGEVIAGGSSVPANPKSMVVTKLDTAGNLDTNFGGVTFQGKVRIPTAFASGTDTMTDMAIGAGALNPMLDKIVMVGSAVDNSGAICTNGQYSDQVWYIAVYNSDGTPYTTFNGTGLKREDFFGCSSAPTAVAIQEDGRIVVIGTAFDPAGNGTSYYVFLRYLTTGLPDPSVAGGTGRILYPQSNTFGINDMVIIPSGLSNAGKFITVGTNTNDFVVNRFNVDGSVDNTFPNSGTVITPITAGSDSATSVKLYPDGRILAGGFAGSDGFAMARYSAGGVLDPNFGTNGTGGTVLTTSVSSGNDAGRTVNILPNGLIVMTGNATTAQPLALGIARYRGNGTLDTTFKTTGTVTYTFGNGTGGAANLLDNNDAAILQSDGKLLAGGTILASGQNDNDFYVARFQNSFTTAAGVSVSGRVMAPGGRGLTNAQVTLSGPDGSSRSIATGRSGVFVFDDVETGKSYIVSVGSRRFSYEPLSVQVNNNVSEIMFYP